LQCRSIIVPNGAYSPNNPAPAASADAFLEHMESSESPRKATRAAGAAAAEPLWSHLAAWDELLVPISAETGRAGLDLGEDWPGRWTATWKTSGDQVSCSVTQRDTINIRRTVLKATRLDAGAMAHLRGMAL
jgi:hypothetical protein